MVPKLLTGEETAVYGDSGYLGAEKRDDAIIRNTKGKKVKYKINLRLSARRCWIMAFAQSSKIPPIPGMTSLG